jgi:predicted nucleic acid-binding protein
MPAVSDTSPILGLAAIGLLDLLKSQFETVFIPQAVLGELKVETNFRGTSAIQQALKNGWLELREVQNKPLAQALSLELDQGESESIALAVDLGIQILVMDETMGRERARAMGLQTVGVLGVLLNAKKHKQIKSVKEVMESLRQGVGFFISDDLFQQVLKAAGEAE